MIGIDLVSCERITKLKSKLGTRFLRRFLTKREIKLAKNDATIAGFWALKEASAKALGCGICAQCGFKDIRIYKTKLGAPYIKLSKRALKEYKKRTNKTLKKRADASLSHDGGMAIAIVKLSK